MAYSELNTNVIMITRFKIFDAVARKLQFSVDALENATDDLYYANLKRSTRRLTKSKKLLREARQLLGSQYYTEQFKNCESDMEKLTKMRREISDGIRNSEIIGKKMKDFCDLSGEIYYNIDTIQRNISNGILK